MTDVPDLPIADGGDAASSLAGLMLGDDGGRIERGVAAARLSAATAPSARLLRNLLESCRVASSSSVSPFLSAGLPFDDFLSSL